MHLNVLSTRSHLRPKKELYGPRKYFENICISFNTPNFIPERNFRKKTTQKRTFFGPFWFFLALRKHMIRINNSGKHLIFLLNAKFWTLKKIKGNVHHYLSYGGLWCLWSISHGGEGHKTPPEGVKETPFVLRVLFSKVDQTEHKSINQLSFYKSIDQSFTETING